MILLRHFRVARRRFRSLWQRDAVDAELSRELAFHYEALVREYTADGRPPDAARHAARRALGNLTLIQEQCREHRRVGWLDDLVQDVRFGLRLLWKARGFTAVAAVSLAIGVGANTAIAGALYAAFFEPLPFPDGEQLVLLRTSPLDNPGAHTHASLPDFVAWRDGAQSFAGMGASIADQRPFAFDDGTFLEGIVGQAFTPSLFATLGVAPMLGRVFTDEEAQFRRVAPVIVISHRLWQAHFEGDPSIVGREVRLNRQPISIIGVMPPDFRYPHHRPDFWSPLALNEFQLDGSTRLYAVTARLKPGVSLAQAQAELDAFAARLAADAPDRHGGWGAFAWPVREALYGWTRQPLLTLYAAVGLVLLIACANVAALLLARATVRGPEMKMRAALGAGRGRVIRQLLTESMLLALAGGVLGIVVAWLGVHAVRLLGAPPGGTTLREIEMNVPLLGITMLLSVMTGLLFGLVPAVTARGSAFTPSIGRGVRRAAGWAHDARRAVRMREGLVIAQVALALILLTGFGLLMNSFVRLAGRELNFEPGGLLTFDYRIPAPEYTRHLGTYRGLPFVETVPPPSITLERIHETLRAIPGVHSVAGISTAPLDSLVVPAVAVALDDAASGVAAPAWDGGLWNPAMAQNRGLPGGAYFLVTPGLFSTIGAPIVRGREIDARDTAAAPWVVVVNEAAARRFWPDDDPIGRRLVLDISPEEPPREVVGVVRDLPLRRRQTTPAPVIYASYLQQPVRVRGTIGGTMGRLMFVARPIGDPMSLVPAVRRAVAEVDPGRSIENVSTVSFQLGEQMRAPFYYTLGIGLFALTAAGLAAMGLYGLIAYAVAQRTREIGIRAAFGADRRDILALVGGRAVALTALGIAGGLVGALAFGRVIESQLWGVGPGDPLTLAGVALLLVIVSGLACLVPARRALAVNPAETLRVE